MSITVTGLIRSETDNAILLRVPVDNGTKGNEAEVWFPKSQISYTRKTPTSPERLNFHATITIPGWLASKKQVIADDMLPKDYFSKEPLAGARLDGKTGQYFPTIDGKDTSPTSFSEERAVQLAKEQIEKGTPPSPRQIYILLMEDSGIPGDPEAFESVDKWNARGSELLLENGFGIKDGETALDHLCAYFEVSSDWSLPDEELSEGQRALKEGREDTMDHEDIVLRMWECDLIA